MPTERPGQRLTRRLQRLLAMAGALAGLAAVVLLAWPAVPLPQPADAVSPAAGQATGAAGCAAGSRRGPAGRNDDWQTSDGLAVSVVTPRNYQAGQAHGLLVVFPPAGFSRGGSERFYGLTTEATRRGWVVAYPAALPLSARAVALQARVAAEVAQHWCIDGQRIAQLGHSDGGSLAQGTVLRATPGAPAVGAVVASAAGLALADLQREACPPALQLTVLHNPHDAWFPGLGAQAVRWWAACWRCAPLAEPRPGQCVHSTGCAAGAHVRHCAVPEAHTTWPAAARAPWAWLAPTSPTAHPPSPTVQPIS